MFHVGQKVVCVDAWKTNKWGIRELNEGCVYVIRKTGACCEIDTMLAPRGPRRDLGDSELVQLVEIKRPQECLFCAGEPGFSALRFRPITERKTDISELKKLCEPTPAKSVEVVR